MIMNRYRNNNLETESKHKKTKTHRLENILAKSVRTTILKI
jgi:hypothetical protein